MKFQKGHVAWNKGKRWKWSAESKKKLSQATKGKPHSHKGAPHTEESKRKIGMTNRGKQKPPEEHSRKIAQALRGKNSPNYGKKSSEETKQVK
jgi:NUMOD3 motif